MVTELKQNMVLVKFNIWDKLNEALRIKHASTRTMALKESMLGVVKAACTCRRSVVTHRPRKIEFSLVHGRKKYI